MKHLRYLKILNQLSAAMVFFICSIIAIVIQVMGSRFYEAGTIDAYVMTGSAVFTFALGLIFGLIYWMLGSRIGRGRWRIPQTIFAVLGLFNNPPLGLLYGLYALWICWKNPESKKIFDDGGFY